MSNPIDPKKAIDINQKLREKFATDVAAGAAFPIEVNLAPGKMPDGRVVPRSIKGSGLSKKEYYASKLMAALMHNINVNEVEKDLMAASEMFSKIAATAILGAEILNSVLSGPVRSTGGNDGQGTNGKNGQ